MAVMLWLCKFATLLISRGMFEVTYWSLLAILLLLPCYQSLWLGERCCNNGLLVNGEPLQCDCMPQTARHTPPFGYI